MDRQRTEIVLPPRWGDEARGPMFRSDIEPIKTLGTLDRRDIDLTLPPSCPDAPPVDLLLATVQRLCSWNTSQRRATFDSGPI